MPQPGREAGDDLGSLVDQVVLLSWILLQVIQFVIAVRGMDQLVRPVEYSLANTLEAPAPHGVVQVLGARVVVLHDHQVRAGGIREQRREALPCFVREFGQDHGREIVRDDERVVAGRGPLTGPAHDQRNLNRFLVDVLGMLDEVMFAEILPVVRRHHDHRIGGGPGTVQTVQQRAHLLVQVGDRRVVLIDDLLRQSLIHGLRCGQHLVDQAIQQLVAPGRGRVEEAGTRFRVVRTVGVDVVHEEEVGLRGLIEPFEDVQVQELGVDTLHVVGLEALVQMPLAGQVPGVGHEGPCLVTLGSQRLGQRQPVAIQRVDVARFLGGKRVCAVGQRGHAGEHRSVRGHRPGSRRKGACVERRGS